MTPSDIDATTASKCCSARCRAVRSQQTNTYPLAMAAAETRTSSARAVSGVVSAVHDATGRDDRDGIDRGADELADRLAVRLGGGPAVNGLGGGIPAGDHAGRRRADDGVADVVDQSRLVAERGLGVMPLADVSRDDLYARARRSHTVSTTTTSTASRLPSTLIIWAGYCAVQSPTSRSAAMPDCIAGIDSAATKSVMGRPTSWSLESASINRTPASLTYTTRPSTDTQIPSGLRSTSRR